MRKVAVPLFFCLTFLASYWMHYFLPSKDIVTISGINLKRAEGVPARGATPAKDGADMYFIFGKNEKGDAAAYKNQDTGWGWPPYFKFEAAELQAKAQTLVGQKVIIKYYGWRNKFFGLFPNIISLEKGTDTDQDSTASWTRRIVFTAWVLGVLYVFSKLLDLFAGGKKK